MLAALAFLGTPTHPQNLTGKVKNGAMECAQSFKFDTGNGSNTFISWACAAAIGLGTIDDNGTPANMADDKFTPTDPAQAMGSANDPDGAGPSPPLLTFWIYPVEVCVTDSSGNECCLNVNVNVVKDRTGQNPQLDKGLLSASWINAAGTCSTGAPPSLVVRWQDGAGPWTLTAPAAPTTPTPDAPTGDTKEVVPATATGPGGATEVDLVLDQTCPMTILPASVAGALGILPTATVDITGTEVEESLITSGMNRTQQTLFPVASVNSLQFPFGAVSGQVLISDDANSDFGILGGNMFAGLTMATNPSSPGGWLLGLGVVSGIPTLGTAGALALALSLAIGGARLVRRRRVAV